ncbi:MAG: hypothetical protein R3E87_27220 [Burkholderiaceae bacterium]
MQPQPDIYRSELQGLRIEVRPEWLAGRYWWRIHLDGHGKVLLRHLDHAIRVAEILADDEALHRREVRSG